MPVVVSGNQGKFMLLLYQKGMTGWERCTVLICVTSTSLTSSQVKVKSSISRVAVAT